MLDNLLVGCDLVGRLVDRTGKNVSTKRRTHDVEVTGACEALPLGPAGCNDHLGITKWLSPQHLTGMSSIGGHGHQKEEIRAH